MKNFLIKHKIPLILFAVCLLIAVGSGTYLKNSDLRFQNDEYQNSDKSIYNLKSEITNLQSNPASISSTATPTSSTSISSSTTIASPVIPHPEPEFANPVTLTVNGEEYKVELRNNMSVYDLMGALAVSSIKPFIFSAKEYSGMGYFVESINGIDNNANNSGKYWIYYLNGESAKVGISNYILKPNDLIEWKYETTNF